MLAQAYRGLPLFDVWTTIERPITEDHNNTQHGLKATYRAPEIDQGGHLIGLKYTYSEEEVEIWLPVSGFRREIEHSLANWKLGQPFWFFGWQNTNLVEDIQFFLPDKFYQIPFSGYRDKVQNVSANQGPGGHFGFFPISRKKISRVRYVRAISQGSSNSLQRF